MTASRRMNPEPCTRAEFDKLLNERARLREQLRQADISVTLAKARGVEPVTAENLTIEQVMSFGLRLDRNDRAGGELVEAWVSRGDKSARDALVAAINAEAAK